MGQSALFSPSLKLTSNFYLKFYHSDLGKEITAVTASCKRLSFFLWVCSECTFFWNKTGNFYTLSELEFSHPHMLWDSAFHSPFTKNPQALLERELCQEEGGLKIKMQIYQENNKEWENKTTLTRQSHCTFISGRFRSLAYSWTKRRSRHEEESQTDVNEAAKM